MNLDNLDKQLADHLARGNQHLRRARLIGASLTIFFVAHLEFIVLRCADSLGLQQGFFAITYPLLLGGFILFVLVRRRGEG